VAVIDVGEVEDFFLPGNGNVVGGGHVGGREGGFTAGNDFGGVVASEWADPGVALVGYGDGTATMLWILSMNKADINPYLERCLVI
jgi:hypothetical protein